MKALGVLALAGLFALICFSLGYSIGNRQGYALGSRDGYANGTHAVCTRMTAAEGQVGLALKSVPNLDPSRAQALLAVLVGTYAEACGR